MSGPKLSVEGVVPGGILPADHEHRVINDNTCSRCRREIGEDEVPIILWGDQGSTMWIYCNDCDANEARDPVDEHGDDGIAN